MIELLGAALGLVVNTLFVQLEARMTGVDRHRHRSDGSDGLLQLLLAAFLDVDEAAVAGADELLLEAALLILYIRVYR